MSPAPLVTLVDRALPPRRFAALLQAIEALGGERLRESYQTTFWYPLDAPPSNLVEAAVQRLRAHLPQRRRHGVTGVEWWLSRMRTSNVKVDFHRDRDNARAAATGEERNPKTSSVLYLNECRGGLLAVTRQPPDPRELACAPRRHDFDLVAPRANRFTCFDGRLTHGVLDARNELPGKRLPREPGLRLAIAINWWVSRPCNVPTFGQTRHYRGLAVAG